MLSVLILMLSPRDVDLAKELRGAHWSFPNEEKVRRLQSVFLNLSSHPVVSARRAIVEYLQPASIEVEARTSGGDFEEFDVETKRRFIETSRHLDVSVITQIMFISTSPERGKLWFGPSFAFQSRAPWEFQGGKWTLIGGSGIKRMGAQFDSLAEFDHFAKTGKRRFAQMGLRH